MFERDVNCFVVYKEIDTNERIYFRSIDETIRYIIANGGSKSGLHYKRRKVKNAKKILQEMLDTRGANCLYVFYRNKHPQGWMMSDRMTDNDWMDFLGKNFAEAARFIRNNSELIRKLNVNIEEKVATEIDRIVKGK